jgi:tetratricopeptide (TPR) repeat protein
VHNPLKEPADALDQAYAQIHRDGRRDYATVRWFAHRALERGRPAEAREAARAWLALELKDPGLERVIMRATLSRAHYAEGDFQRAWDAVEPVLASGQGGALRAGARAAARLGRQEEAQRIWDYVRQRYPGASTQLDYAQFLWEQRRYKEAADAIMAWPHRLRTQDWALTIAPAFFEATRDWPEADIVAAFDAFKPRGIPGHLLAYVPAKFSGEGRHALAFRMRKGLRDSELGHVELLVAAYRDLRLDQGAAPALAWLRQAIPSQFLNASSMVFYKRREPDLLWELIQDPDDGAHGEWVWLIRAASAVRDAEQSPERLRQLREYFDDAGDPVELLGRYLLDLEGEDAVRQYPWPAQNIYEAAYFLGLKEHCRGNLEAAADWYQVVVELAAPNKGEFHWAQDQLYYWYAAGQLLSRQPAGCEAPDRAQGPGT